MSAHISTPEDGSWLRILCSGRPHQVVRNARGDYLHRWFLIPQNRWCNVYLHLFVGSDDPPALHNHPWPFVSLLLWRGYLEITDEGIQRRRPGALAFRPANHRHRIQLTQDGSGRERPCLSIVVTGARQQLWGFFCPQPKGRWRFIPWREFSAGGCGETA